MLEVLTALVGGVLRLLPSVVDLFHKKQENAQELALITKQVELAKVQGEQKLQEIQLQHAADNDAAEASGILAAIQAQAKSTGIAWVDALNATVRPVLTYWHCVIVYTAYKLALFYVAVHGGVPWANALVDLYTDFDRAMVSSMISFWFVDRALRKLGR